METKWKEKRTAVGKVKPYIFAGLEITALLMCIWLISTFNILLLSTLSYLGAMFYIVTTVVPRYKKSIYRQKYNTISIMKK
jgi:hypothetical protein